MATPTDHHDTPQSLLQAEILSELDRNKGEQQKWTSKYETAHEYYYKIGDEFQDQKERRQPPYSVAMFELLHEQKKEHEAMEEAKEMLRGLRKEEEDLGKVSYILAALIRHMTYLPSRLCVGAIERFLGRPLARGEYRMLRKVDGSFDA
ncbi:hypothetical protein MMC24_002994 [Lignoscripta atroalba]|nr:hypothetical protein [Lignoscripta atroalba]